MITIVGTRAALVGSVIVLALSFSAERLAAAGASHIAAKSFSAAGVRHVVVDLSFANVNIAADVTGEIQAKVTRSASGNSAEQARWLAGENLSIGRSGDEVVIRDSKPSGGDSTNNHDRHQDLELHLPSNLAVSLTIGAGNIDANGPVRMLDADYGAGNIVLRDAGIQGSPVVHIGASKP